MPHARKPRAQAPSSEQPRSRSAAPGTRPLDQRQLSQIAERREREPGARAPISIPEGRVEVAPVGAGIRYGAVTSCMTVTCYLDDGRKAGAHMVLVTGDGAQLASHQILSALRGRLDGKVGKVELIGDFESWQTKYLKLPAFEGGYDLPDDPRPLKDAILEELGLSGTPVETRQHAEGDLTL